MKFLLFMQIVTTCSSLLQARVSNDDHGKSNLRESVHQIIVKILSNHARSTEIIYEKKPLGSSLYDFLDDLLGSLFEELVNVHQESPTNLSSKSDIRKCSVVLINTFEEFQGFYQSITMKRFQSNGLFIIVLMEGEILEIDDMFEAFWSIQIYNVIVVHETDDEVINVKTFMPFKAEKCSDTSSVLVNSFQNGRFTNDYGNLFPRKMHNLHNCPIRISISNSSKPAVIINWNDDDTFKLSGRDISFMTALSLSLNFTTNFTFIGVGGYLYENGSAEGPLKAVMDGVADLAVSDCWLKANRLKFLDSTTSYISQQVIFLTSPVKELSPYEKLVYPFTLVVWTLILIYFAIGFLVIFIINRQPQSVQSFVFGKRVKHPSLNLISGFIGGTQRILPGRNFARFILMSFLMYSLVIRTIYQGSFFQLMHSSRRHREAQTIDELIERNQILIFDNMADMFQDSEIIMER